MKGIFILFLAILICSCQKNDNISKTENTITTIVPLPPTDLKINDFSAVQVDLVWVDRSTNEKGFKIQRKQGTSIYSDIASVGPDVTNYSDKTVEPNTSYAYRIYSYNSAGQSATYSNESTIKTMSFDLKSGLIAYFPFTGSSLDSSGNNNNGTLNKNVSLTSDRKNINNNAYLFSNGFINFNTPLAFSIKKEVTISSWVYLTASGGGYQCLLCEPDVRYTSSSDNSIGLFVTGSGLIGRVISDNGGGMLTSDQGFLNISRWYHVAYTFDNSGLSILYIDGKNIAKNQGKPINDGDYIKRYYIGSQSNELQIYGKIDDLRLYNRALNEYEIKILSQQ